MCASRAIDTPADTLLKELAASNTSFSLVAAHTVVAFKVISENMNSLNIALNFLQKGSIFALTKHTKQSF